MLITRGTFRNRAVSTAAKIGLVDYVIKMMGRWESVAYQRYILTPKGGLCIILMSWIYQIKGADVWAG